jgi:ubiquinone/menaquinone biosynthesis C-methylase UbiE
MSFDVSGNAYDAFMGRYARELAPVFADFAGVRGGSALDVGCGSGLLTEELARRLGAENVAAADPSPLLEACAARVPGADVRSAPAEALPWPDGSFDAALAQLVIHFLDDPVTGLAEMRRVVRPGGTVAACTWDFPNMRLLGTFWEVARELDPEAPAENRTHESLEELAELGRHAGLEGVQTAMLDVSAHYESFDELWDTFLLAVGPAGEYCLSLPPLRQEGLREEYRRRIGEPDGSFSLPARAWALRGRA